MKTRWIKVGAGEYKARVKGKVYFVMRSSENGGELNGPDWHLLEGDEYVTTFATKKSATEWVEANIRRGN